MAFKRPFGKIRKVEDGAPPAKPQSDPIEQPIQPPTSAPKGPLMQLGKQRKNIYDALKKDEPPKEEEPVIKPQQPEDKKGLQLRPNLRAKRDIKLPPKPMEKAPDQHENDDMKTPQLHQVEAPRPTPIFKARKNSGNRLRAMSRQKVVVNELQQAQAEVDGFEDSAANIKPDLRIKRKPQPVVQEPAKTQSNEQAETSYPNLLVQTKIQFKSVNVEEKVQQASEEKLLRQAKRVADLSKILNLEIDLFEETFNLEPASVYEVYLNKIKSGSLKHAGFMSFDDCANQATQTQTYQSIEFSGQCPQDYSSDAIQRDATSTSASDHLQVFLARVAPVIQELIRPTSQVTAPPTLLLSFRPVFRQLFRIPFPALNYSSEEFGIGLLVVGQKLYIAESQIQSVIMMGNRLVAGLADCTIAVWDGFNDYGSYLYRKLTEHTQSTNFQLPCFVTSQSDRMSSYACDSPVVGLAVTTNSELWSVDANAKMIKWRLEQRVDRVSYLKPLVVVELGRLAVRESLVAYQLKQRLGSLFVNSSAGILATTESELTTLIDVGDVTIIDFELPKRPALLYAACSDSTIRIYSESSSQLLAKTIVQTPLGASLKYILLPEIEYEGKELYVLYYTTVVDSEGNIYVLSLGERGLQATLLGGSGKDEEEEDDDRRGVIFRGAILREDVIERFCLYRNLNCQVECLKLGISMAKSVPNMKKILAQNRRFMGQIESQAYYCV